MKVKCTRDDTTFEAVIQPYPIGGRQTRLYDKDGDRCIDCPTCARRYFYYNGGSAVGPDDPQTGWHSDRPLKIIQE